MISAISTNSSSQIFFASFIGSTAAGLNGPGADMVEAGIFPTGIGTATSDAAAASRSNPELAGEKIGIDGNTNGGAPDE